MSEKTKIEWCEWDNPDAWLEWGEIECPLLNGERVMTYYPKGELAFDSYTKPFLMDDGGVCVLKFDHDEGCWYDSFYIIREEGEEGGLNW